MAQVDVWVKKHRTRLSGAVAIVFLILSRPTYITLLCGAVPILIGQCIRIWSSGHIHKNEMLTVEGPYSLSRNPLYLGSFILGTGFIISMGVIWMGAVYFLFYGFVYLFTIKWEEEKLARKFPREWGTYQKAVPRFLPLLALPEYRPGEFSWGQVIRYKELLNASVVMLVYVLLWIKAFVMQVV